jgi:hypothetical protein
MKRIVIGLFLAAAIVVGLAGTCGCSGVWMNAEYSQLLDRTAALSAEAALRARSGELTGEQMTDALVKQAETWRRFQDARDGRTGR